VLDLDQPTCMHTHRHVLSCYFVPRSVMESYMPGADVLHNRSLDDSTPLARLLIAHSARLNREIGSMQPDEAQAAVLEGVQLLVAAFGKQMRLSGSARNAARAAMYGQAREYIRAHLDDAELSAEKVLRALQLPRHTVYRLFEAEGGIASFIWKSRLQAAAQDIANQPYAALKDIAYGTGFNSASAFSRMFRREYGMTPQELREHVHINRSPTCPAALWRRAC
jgi:AraC-like DNA-binding protein